MSGSPADGERNAARGYKWQYDHIATHVYDALLEDDLGQVRLVDPEAGRVDDLVLVRNGRVDAYQFKSSEHPSSITFKQLIGPQQARGGTPRQSIVRDLAEGWQRQLRQCPDAHVSVHLVTANIASTSKRWISGSDGGPGHFAAFLKQVLGRIRSGELAVGDVGSEWHPALDQLRNATGLAEKDFALFLASLHIKTGVRSALPEQHSPRRDDINSLSSALWGRVAGASGAVKFDTRDVLSLMGWSQRVRLHSRHDFPVDLDTYAPLSDAVDELQSMLADRERGYIAVIGPPGTGKSTLLSQAFTGSTDRIVRYYAYVPHSAPLRPAMTAAAFLHDVVLMLNKSGVKAKDHILVNNDTTALQQSLADHLNAACSEFAQTDRRTIIVVDGLDHVERDVDRNEGLLAVLPRPEELPEGILFVVGSRTLDPLDPHTCSQIEESGSVVNLRDHRLPRASILEICGKFPAVACHSPQIHQRVADLSDGHPLTLAYLLNLLSAADVESAEEALEAVPAYEGDIAASYRAVWDGLQNSSEIVEILSVCSRLRIGFETRWLKTWTTEHAVRLFRQKFMHLFREHADGWRFFHDSFRQFAADRTALGDHGQPDDVEDSDAHARVAELCAGSDDNTVAAEELYHRFRAGHYDRVLSLAELATFREQHCWLRSLDLIRSDMEAALGVAADSTDVAAMLKMILALSETDERTQSLDEVDLPGLLYDVGLVEKAVVYCGDARRVPLAHAYGLAAKLAESGDPAGRRLFDRLDPAGLDDRDTTYPLSGGDEVLSAWAHAAALCRPIENVVTAARGLVTHSRAGHVDVEFGENTGYVRWLRYEQVVGALIDTAVRRRDERELEFIAVAVTEEVIDSEDADSDTRDQILAVLADLRISALSALIDLAENAESKQSRLDMLPRLGDTPLFHATKLDLAEILVSNGMAPEAAELLDVTGYGAPLTTSSLSYGDATTTIDHEFRYWRLRHILAPGTATPDPFALDRRTPAGNDIASGTQVHSDAGAIEFASLIDSAIWTLARIDASTESGQRMPAADVWSELVRMLHTTMRPSEGISTTLIGIHQRRPAMMEIVVDVAARYGEGIPERLGDLLARLFEQEPPRWPLTMQVNVGTRMAAVGVDVPWHREKIEALETYAATEDVSSRLRLMVDIAHGHARAGQTQRAQEIAMGLIPTAFGVGFRKDYQFRYWVEWLAEALAGPDGERFLDEAAWLARLLKAVAPMSEFSEAAGAADLPGAVVAADPVAAVRTFEYLVRHGAASHCQGAAELLRALVEQTPPAGMATIGLAADFAADILAPAANSAFPKLAESLVKAAERTVGTTQATQLAESVVNRIDKYALPTLRAQWRQGLGMVAATEVNREADEEADDGPSYSRDWLGSDWSGDDLVLSDGQRLTPDEVRSRIRSLQDIAILRSQEVSTSSFPWAEIVALQTLTSDDIRFLANVFVGRSKRDIEVRVLLAETSESNGDYHTALQMASDLMEQAARDAWSYGPRAARRRAAAIAVRLGGADERVRVCRDLARHATLEQWVPSQLHPELHRILEWLAPELNATSTWPVIRSYLEGIAETLDLGNDDDLTDHGCRWWLPDPCALPRPACDENTAHVALAELAVGHISHPTWLVSEAAIGIVSRALIRGDTEVGEALARFAQAATTHDMLESAGRCLAVARTTPEYVAPDSLKPLDRMLAEHPSQVLRNLSSDQSPRPYRRLRGTYGLTLPAPVARIGREATFLAPYEPQYRLLADGLGLDLDTLLSVADQYVSQAIDRLPGQKKIRTALESTRMRHAFPSVKVMASREAFGRVLADLADAGLLANAPPYMLRMLRTVDIDALTRTPGSRPGVMPPPPRAGYDRTISDWQDEAGSRIDEYVQAARAEGQTLIAASSSLTVLNHDHLEEELECGTTVGPDQNGPLFANGFPATLQDLTVATQAQLPGPGEPLVVENSGHTFHQLRARWLAFRPDLAAALAWVPDPSRPGRWYTDRGATAVETVWWVDGWWGRAGLMAEDTAAEGHAVILTSSGLSEVLTVFGEITTCFELRRGTEFDQEAAPVTVTRVWSPTNSF